MLWKPEGSMLRGRERKRWIHNVYRIWRNTRMTVEREEWKKMIEKSYKFTKGCDPEK
jgi:hypothetical protein